MKEKETCDVCKKEEKIVFDCAFCNEGLMCRECGKDHRTWCQVIDEWIFY